MECAKCVCSCMSKMEYDRKLRVVHVTLYILKQPLPLTPHYRPNVQTHLVCTFSIDAVGVSRQVASSFIRIETRCLIQKTSYACLNRTSCVSFIYANIRLSNLLSTCVFQTTPKTHTHISTCIVDPLLFLPLIAQP